MHSVVLDKFYGDDFLKLIEEEADKISLKEAAVKTSDTDEEVQENTRRSKVAFLNSNLIRNELFSVVNYVNAREFGFDIWNVADIQYTVYEANNKGHYDWHPDEEVCVGIARKSARKLSLTVQLSDPSDYEGGVFEFNKYDLPDVIKNKGTVLVFPSPQLHRVTPVTKGVRKSLVAWFEGPDWR